MWVMWVMSVYVDKLLELEELEITNEQIMRYCGLKDRSTITEWWKGVNPLPKNRVKLTRLLEIAREGRKDPPTNKQMMASFMKYSKTKDCESRLTPEETQDVFRGLISVHRNPETFDGSLKILEHMTNAKLCEKFHPDYYVREHFKKYNALI